MRMFRQRAPSTDASVISPVRSPSIDAAKKFYAASVLGPLAGEIALSSVDGSRGLRIRIVATDVLSKTEERQVWGLVPPCCGELAE